MRLSAVLSLLAAFFAGSVVAAEPNALSKDEQQAGFKLLFNGRDLSGWEHSGNWKVEDGVIARQGQGGSLVYKTKKVPDNIELRFEWKVAPGSNSGVYYRPGQYEYQILDNAKHADGKNPRTSAASLYFGVAPSRDATRPVGQWNEGRIVCQGTVIQHWLNGEKVVDIDYTDPQRKDEVELLRLRGGNLADRGAYLNLQDHGDPVWYRGIKLREVSETEKLDRTPVKPAEISAEALKIEQEKLQRILDSRKPQAK